jgi:putative transposase
MARLRRIDLAGVLQHVLQRGNNRSPCFFEVSDYTFYLDCLMQAAHQHDCAVYAYVLMTNHVHLLVSGAQVGGVSAMMQTLGRRYVRGINQRYGRTGTLWEGRFKSSVIESERYLLTCYRYIELNPVRAGMVKHPGDYRWSSYRRHTLVIGDAWLVDHACYLALGRDVESRQTAYQALFQHPLVVEELSTIRSRINRSGILGSDRFQEEIAVVLGRRVQPGKPGRPRQTPGSSHPERTILL